MQSKRILLLSVVAASLLFGGETKKLEDITVSANKVEENIQEVPQSITVLDEEILEEKGIKNVHDVIQEVPNMVSDLGSHGTGVNFRGLNASNFTNNNPVVIYIDGVPYYDRYDFDPSLTDVAQIEILRGPQGTLYGKDAMGAVINIITKTPQNGWSGKIGAEYGNHNYMEGRLSANGAIIDDKLYAGFNAFGKSDDGWITNNYPGADEHANEKNDRKLSAFLLFKPIDRLSGKLTINDNYSENHFINGYAVGNNISVNQINRKDAKNVSFEVPTFANSKTKSQSLNLGYEFDTFKLESTTTHKDFSLEGEYDADFMSNQPPMDGLKQYNYTDLEYWTQELKASGEQESFKWVTGLYFDDETREQGPYGIEFPNFDPKTKKFLGNVEMNADSKAKSNTKAIFAQTMIPFGEHFELTLGGRYQKIEKDIDLKLYMRPIGDTKTPPMFTYKSKREWDVFLPKVALSYVMNDNLTFYTSFSQGYMPGGFNYFATGGDDTTNSFEPQRSTNYEVGAKYMDSDFALNVSVFRMDIKDIHIYRAIGGQVWLTDNADKAHSQGIEIDATYFLTNHWELSGAIGLIDAKYDNYDTGVAKYNGKRIEDTPRYTANLGLAYVSEKGVYGRVDLYGRGETSYFDGANDAMKEFDGAVTANAKIGYRYKDFDIYGYINNITNEEYVTYFMSKQGLSVADFNEPRRFGIGVRYKF